MQQTSWPTVCGTNTGNYFCSIFFVIHVLSDNKNVHAAWNRSCCSTLPSGGATHDWRFDQRWQNRLAHWKAADWLNDLNGIK